jgi:hypothetical protein
MMSAYQITQPGQSFARTNRQTIRQRARLLRELGVRRPGWMTGGRCGRRGALDPAKGKTFCKNKRPFLCRLRGESERRRGLYFQILARLHRLDLLK